MNGLVWLSKSPSHNERDCMIVLLRFIPSFDPLRSHPRYHALLRKMNLSSEEE